MAKKLLILVLGVLSIPALAQAGTTGKISGVVRDGQTGDALPGANVIIEGTTMGAATSIDGNYFIINVPVGVYTVKAAMMGYQAVRVTNVRVNIDGNTKVNFDLPVKVLEAGEVVVTAERPIIQADLTSSHAYVTAEEIDAMPVDRFQDVLALQAGFVRGANGNLHIRGGRATEVTYMVDGMYVQNPLMTRNSYSSGEPNTNLTGQAGGDINNNAVQAIEVVSGTYNAEYGQAMSGVVNIVTKSGGSEYHGQIRGLTDDFTKDAWDWSGRQGDTDDWNTVDNRKKNEWDWNTYNLDASFGGPIPGTKRKGTFFVSGEYFKSDGWLYGFNRYKGLPDSITDFTNDNRWDAPGWEEKPVSMQPEERLYGQAKLAYSLKADMRLTLSGWMTQRDYKTYSHSYKYIPWGIPDRHRESAQVLLSWNHQLSPSTFYTLRVSRFHQLYHRTRFDQAFDPQVTATDQDQNYEFNVRGGYVSWHKDSTRTYDMKLDLTSQVHPAHEMKAGVEFKKHRLQLHDIGNQTVAAPLIIQYVREPSEASAYIQDKIEHQGMILNVGLRMDYVDPNDTYPANELEPLDAQGNIKSPVKAETKTIFSPRLGMAYPITDRAVLHFAYGQFSQVPEYQYLYDNPKRDLRHYYPNVGNPDVKPEKTSAFEVGIQTQLGENVGVDISGFYKDITDYVTSKIVPAVPDPYTLVTNIDYANVKGVTVSVRKRHSGYFGGTLNYTYQVAKGNSSDPFDTVNDVFAQPPRETEKHMLYLDWDQTHTVSVYLNSGVPGNWGVNLTGELGSGLPYTPSGPLGRIPIADENSERKPVTHSVDIIAHKEFEVMGLDYSIFLDVRNVFNQRNELWVYGSTGRADVTLSPNATEDSIKDPSNFSRPRNMRLGMQVSF